MASRVLPAPLHATAVDDDLASSRAARLPGRRRHEAKDWAYRAGRSQRPASTDPQTSLIVVDAGCRVDHQMDGEFGVDGESVPNAKPTLSIASVAVGGANDLPGASQLAIGSDLANTKSKKQALSWQEVVSPWPQFDEDSDAERPAPTVLYAKHLEPRVGRRGEVLLQMAVESDADEGYWAECHVESDSMAQPVITHDVRTKASVPTATGRFGRQRLGLEPGELQSVLPRPTPLAVELINDSSVAILLRSCAISIGICLLLDLSASSARSVVTFRRRPGLLRRSRQSCARQWRSAAGTAAAIVAISWKFPGISGWHDACRPRRGR
jgi:hypothetical protein